MESARRDLYAVLGVPVDASQEEITHAYRRLLREHHPDTRRADQDAALADAALLDVLGAYAVLRHPQLRAEYDRRHGRTGTAAGGSAGGTFEQRPDVTDSAPVRVTVRRRAGRTPQPPLRAGPLRWEP